LKFLVRILLLGERCDLSTDIELFPRWLILWFPWFMDILHDWLNICVSSWNIIFVPSEKGSYNSERKMALQLNNTSISICVHSFSSTDQ
jgi:hypothetical protein